MRACLLCNQESGQVFHEFRCQALTPSEISHTKLALQELPFTQRRGPGQAFQGGSQSEELVEAVDFEWKSTLGNCQTPAAPKRSWWTCPYCPC